MLLNASITIKANFYGEDGQKNAYKYVHQFREKVMKKENSSPVLIKARKISAHHF